jgi:DNA-binding transcriptional ArsR family regulator
MSQGAQATHAVCDPRAAADLLRAMAHPMRLTILCRLLDGEMPVSAFESEMGLKQPSLSQQLGLLREAGLVSTRRESKSVVYCLANDRLHVILDALRSFFADTPLTPAHRQAPMPTRPVAPSQMPQPMRPVVSVATECGVFSVAGWPADQGSDGGRNRG